MILVLDNYDSFVYNLVQYIGAIRPDVEVARNDAVTIEELRRELPEAIVISPGPGRPENAGIAIDVVRLAAKAAIPLLGVCLGHQAIAAAYGAAVVPARQIMHGKTDPVEHAGIGLFANISSPFEVMRYHSLLVDPHSIPSSLRITATSSSNEVMALAAVEAPIVGVQFHPESIATEHGEAIIRNFLLGVDRHD